MEIQVELVRVEDEDGEETYTWTTYKGRVYTVYRKHGLWMVKTGGGFAVPELEGAFTSINTVILALKQIAFRTEHKSERDKMNYTIKKGLVADAVNTEDTE